MRKDIQAEYYIRSIQKVLDTHPGEYRYDAVDEAGILSLSLIWLETGNKPDSMGCFSDAQYLHIAQELTALLYPFQTKGHSNDE